MKPIHCLSMIAFAAGAAAVLPGCIGTPVNPPATQPATAIDPKSAEAGYWFDRSGIVSINHSDFDALWKACKLAARDDGFILDRPGYRDGLMTTQPLTSMQFFQPWRQDIVDGHALLQSSLGTMRRTIHFEIAKSTEGATTTYACVPKVLVERFQTIERRVTNETEYRDVFNLTRQELSMQSERERDPTAGIPPMYWYAVGRDYALESQLADLIRGHLSRPKDLQGIMLTG